MRRLLTCCFALTIAAGAVCAQPVQTLDRAEGPLLEDLEVVQYAGLSEKIFAALLEAAPSASFHYGTDYDVTYALRGTGLLTVKFFDGKAGFFRLVMEHALPSAEDLVWLLGIDADGLALAEERDVTKSWRGYQDAVPLQEVTAIHDGGWKVAVVKVAGYAHD